MPGVVEPTEPLSIQVQVRLTQTPLSSGCPVSVCGSAVKGWADPLSLAPGSAPKSGPSALHGLPGAVGGEAVLAGA